MKYLPLENKQFVEEKLFDVISCYRMLTHQMNTLMQKKQQKNAIIKSFEDKKSQQISKIFNDKFTAPEEKEARKKLSEVDYLEMLRNFEKELEDEKLLTAKIDELFEVIQILFNLNNFALMTDDDFKFLLTTKSFNFLQDLITNLQEANETQRIFSKLKYTTEEIEKYFSEQAAQLIKKSDRKSTLKQSVTKIGLFFGSQNAMHAKEINDNISLCLKQKFIMDKKSISFETFTSTFGLRNQVRKIKGDQTKKAEEMQIINSFRKTYL